MARICDLADSAKGADDSRTKDQIRADVYLDLLIGNAATKKPGIVNLHVDLETLTRLNENPGELAGYGPVISDVARHFLPPEGGVPERSEGGWGRFIDAREGFSLRAIRKRATSFASQENAPLPASPALPPPGGESHHHTIRHRARWTRTPLKNGDHLHQSRLGHKYTTSGRSP